MSFPLLRYNGAMSNGLGLCENSLTGVTPEVRNSNRRSLVKEVERGRFLFQDKVPFAFDNGTYKCGVCPDMTSPNLMDITKHIRDTHRGEFPEHLFFLIIATSTKQWF